MTEILDVRITNDENDSIRYLILIMNDGELYVYDRRRDEWKNIKSYRD